MVLDPTTPELSRRLRSARQREALSPALARVESALAARPDEPQAWEPLALDSLGFELPPEIRSCWLFVLRAPIRWFARMAVAALVAGAVLGILGRSAMACLAWMGGSRPNFSLGGSSEVVAFGLLVGLPAAAVLALWLRFAPGRAVWKGLGVGLALFALLVLVPPPAARSAAAGAPDAVRQAAVPLFAAAFALYGLLLGWLMRRLAPARPARAVNGSSKGGLP